MEDELNRVHFQEFSIGYENTVATSLTEEIKKEALLMSKPKAQCDKAKAMDEVIMVPVGQEGLMVPRFVM